MSKPTRLFAIVFVFTVLLSPLYASEALLKANHPDRYVVVTGDTLWDISARFLNDPWRWSDIWYVNPQVQNPHLIYPGDQLELVYVNGKPRLQLSRGSRHVKLSPQARITPWTGAINTVPIDAIAPFLSRPYVLDEGEAEEAPYVVAFAEEHIMAGAGQKAYVRKINSSDPGKFDVVRPGGPYKDAETGEILGYEALYLGGAQLQATGDPATVSIFSSEQEILPGDRLLSADEEQAVANFTPHAPARDVNGAIIAVLGGVTQIGQHHIVVLDRGRSDGIDDGTVLRVNHRGETIPDKITADPRDTVTLPDEPAGMLMVFRTFDRVSFALVMEATRAIHVSDRVATP